MGYWFQLALTLKRSTLAIFFLFVIVLKETFVFLETDDSLKSNGCCFRGIFNVGDSLVDYVLQDIVKDDDKLL